MLCIALLRQGAINHEHPQENNEAEGEVLPEGLEIQYVQGSIRDYSSFSTKDGEHDDDPLSTPECDSPR